jgi:rifampin ADP-ribosylating transferase
LEAAIWGAELAVGDGPGRIYIVEPTGEIAELQGHSPERLKVMKDRTGRLRV